MPAILVALSGCLSGTPWVDVSPLAPIPQQTHGAEGTATLAKPQAVPPTPSVLQTAYQEAATGEEQPHGVSKPSSFPQEKEESPKPAIEIRGRIHADAVLVNQSERNKAIIGDVENATGFRRARLGAQGFVGGQVNWVAEFDFAGGSISFKDVFVGVDELPLVKRVRIGHMGEPFSLEGATNSNYFTFVERSPIAALDPFRNWGAGIFSYTENQRATLALAAFRSGTSNNTGDDFGDQNDMAYDVRVTCLPWYDTASDGRYLMHLGGAFSQRFPHNDVVTISQSPQSSLLPVTDNPGSPFIPTITIPASQEQLYNLDWALVLGPVSFQAEWNAASIDQIGGGPVFLHGFYAFASWFLTGENRQYLTKDGIFGMTRVRSPFVCLRDKQPLGKGPGAWELTARLAYVDFASANIPRANGLKVGDRETELTLGVNWYLNDYARLMFNFIHAVPVDPNFGPSWAEAFFIRTAIFW